MAYKITDKCTACGACQDECPVACISEGEIYKIDPEECIDCGACAAVCPVDAIEAQIIIDTFDKNYAQYEEWFIKNKYVYLSELDAVRNFIPRNKNGVEIGVGSGLFAEPLNIKIGIDQIG